MAAPAPLSFLLADISERLMAATGEAGDTPAGEADTIAGKMQTVLLALIGNCTRSQKPKERGLVSVLKLVNLAMARLPAAFSGLRCSTALAILVRLLPLLQEPASKGLHSTILSTAKALITLTADSCQPAYQATVADVLQLLTGCKEALAAFSVPAQLQPESSFNLAPFPRISAFLGQAAEAAAPQPPAGAAEGPAPAAAAQPPGPVRLRSAEQAQLMACGLLQVLGHLLWTNAASLAAAAPALLPRLLLPLLRGGAGVEAQALALLAAALPALRPSDAECQAVAAALAEALLRWHRLRPPAGGSGAWLQALRASLDSLARECPGAASPRLLAALVRVAADATVDSKTRAELCVPLASLIASAPAAQAPAAGLLPAVACGPQAAAALRAAIQRLRQAVGDRELDAALAAELSPQGTALSQSARSGGGSPPAKRQRTGPPGVVDLCSPERELPAWPARQRQAGGGAAAPQAQCARLLRALVALGGCLGPSAAGGLKPGERLATLRSVLLAVRGCLPALLARLGPAVGEWAAWGLASVGSPRDRSEAETRAVAGCVDALLAACVEAELLGAGGATPARASLGPAGPGAAARQPPRARDLLAAAGLTKEQLRALAQPPFAALEQPAGGEPAAALRAAKGAALRLQLGAHLLDPSDGGSPFAKAAPAAKAAADEDPAVRAAAACVAPALVACALRPRPACQAAAALLLRLAGSAEPAVRGAAADGLESLVRCQGAREHRAAAVARAYRAAATALGGEAAAPGWQLAGCGGAPLAGSAAELSPEDLAAAVERLLFKEPDEGVQAKAVRLLAAWYGAASAAEVRPAAALLKRWLRWAAAAGPPVRAALLAAAPSLARQPVVWGAYGSGSAEPRAEDEAAYCKAECGLLQELKGLFPDKPEEVQVALLSVMAALARRMRGASAELLLLGLLLNCIDDARPTVRAVAGSLLLEGAAAKQTSLEDVLLHQPKVLDYCGRNWLARPGLLEELAELLGMEARALQLRVLPAALAHHMAAEDGASLAALAGRLGLSLPELMHQHGHHVVAKHLYEGNTHLGRSIAFIERLLGEGFLALLAAIMQPLIMEIVGQAGGAAEWGGGTALPEAVAERARAMLGELGRIHCNCEDSAAFLAESDQVTRILKRYGDGLDATMASLARGCSPEAAARQLTRTLRCLLLLMRLVGRFVPRFLPQLLVLLGCSLRPEVPEPARLQALEGCGQLVDSLAACAPRLLASIANQVAVTLLEPLQEGGPLGAAAGRVLEALVGRHRPLLRDQIGGLPPLPAGLPALGKAAEALAAERGRLAPAEQVQLLLRSLDHQSVNVRATALQELRDYLNGHRQWLAGLLAASTSAASQDGLVQPTGLLSSLVSALLRCCDAQAQGQIGSRVQLLCSECLGLLGAIDPTRLSIERPAPEQLCASTADLLVQLVSRHLVRLLRVAPSLSVLDAATFAIQELLRCFGDPGASQASGGGRPGSGSGNALFNLLDPEVQPLVQPYLDSRYSLLGTATASSGRVFGRAESAFGPWLSAWLRQLVDSHAAGELLPLFQACRLVMRRDVQTCLFLMPYVIQNALSHGGSAAQAQVRAEVEAVLREGHMSKEGELCVGAIFALLDVLRKWAAELKDRVAKEAAAGKRSGSGGGSGGPSGEEAEAHTRAVSELLDAIPLDLLAQAAFKVGAHARALQYYESYARAKEGGALNPAAHRSVAYANEDVGFLQELYSKLEEPDALAGLTKLRRGGPRQEDQVLAAEQAGRWSEAACAYEQALGSGGGGDCGGGGGEGLTPAQRGRLRCAFHMSHLASMLAQVDEWAGGLHGEGLGELAAIGAAGAWRLGRWAQLDAYLAGAERCAQALRSDDLWEVRIGRLLSSIHRRERAETRRELEAARLAAMPALSAAASESYRGAYPHLVRLHMAQELADTATLLQEGSVAGPLERQRRLRWDERLQVTQSSLAVQEPILALRRQLAAICGAGREAGQCWLQHARGCRAAGHLEAATFAALEARARGVAGAEIEHARLLWDSDESNRAIQQLAQDLGAADAATLQATTQASPEARAEVAHGKTRMLLQLARWKAAKGQGDQNEIRGLFNRAIGLEATSEECYFRFGGYLDALMQGARARQEEKRPGGGATDRIGGKSRIQIGEDRPWPEYCAEVVANYGQAARCGGRFTHQALPRLLTVYFDFGSHMLGLQGAPSSAERKAQRAVGDAMAGLVRELPLAAWLAVLPQLTSRICHPHGAAQAMVQHILVRVTAAYPQQALWALASVSKSRVAGRREAAAAILRTARRTSGKEGAAAAAAGAEAEKGRRQLYAQFPALCDHLIALCHHNPGDKVRVMSAKSDTSALLRMMPLAVVVPTRAALGPALPPPGRAGREGAGAAAAAEPVTIAGMRDRIEVMSSLQRPKKVVLLGSDGREHAFLVKPDDDLRKDSRMMETAGLLNRLFAKDAASRRRNLYIRRFAVTPLTEACGLIEWVSHTTGLRNCCQGVYVAAGRFDRTTNGAIKQMYDGYQGSQMRVLLDQVLALFPPLLHRFFVGQWPEPAAWHTSRAAFARTAAVWCMVGHMLGLGDRHGENIMVDTRTGDCVHIDFACLFDKGLTLAKPEMVPFRLTQNVVDACGVSGHEGGFRRVCEITLRVLREHRGALASVLETFLHDPLVDWTPGRGAAVEPGEENPQARDAMATIQGRLTGTLLGVRSTPSLPLSVESQVHWLIEEATNKENLGKMYIWWMPWF